MDLFSGSEGGSSRSSSPTIDIVEARADFAINEEYAARFQHNKQRAELHQLQEKHGNGQDEEEEDSSSEDETEDEEGEQVTADVDAAILTTLAKIRRKDESIYEAGKRVFDDERTLASNSKLLPRTLSRGDDGKKRVTLAKYQRTRIQELMKTSDDPARALADATMIQRRDDQQGQSEEIQGAVPHSREQEDLQREVTRAFHSSAGDGEDDFFTKKSSGELRDEGNAEDDPESYRRFLLSVLGGQDKEEEVRTILRAQTDDAAAGDVPKPARGKAPKVRVDDGTEQENEEFLMNYVLNRGWVENPSAAPKAKAIKSGKEKKQSATAEEEAAGFSDLDSEDSFDSRADAFENAYNFRFEEMEGGEADTQIQSYARNPIGSVRRTEDKRKKEREERSKRKEEEREEKKREIDRMRDLKRRAIVDRLKKLKEATGSSNVDFERFELDNDFDPEEHDRLMQRAFDDDYYGDQDDEKKPSWDDDVELDDIVAQGTKKRKGKTSEIEMDADFVDDGPGAEKKLSKAEKKKLKKREKAKARKAEEEGPGRGGVGEEEMNAEAATEDVDNVALLNADEKREKMKEAMDEYYGLEYEDMIGDQPTRFKYTQVAPSTFGLTPEEILLADDEDLKGVVSLKRLQPYKDGRKKPSDLNARLKEFRRRFHQQQHKQGEEEEREEKSKTKRMGKKERQRRKEASEKAAAAASTATEHDVQPDATASTSAVEEGKRPSKKARQS